MDSHDEPPLTGDNQPDPATADPTTPRVVVRRSEPPVAETQDAYGGLSNMEEASWPMDQEPPPPPPRRSSVPPFIIGLLLGAALATVSVVSFLALREDPNAAPAPPPAPIESSLAESGIASTVTTLELSTTTTLPPASTLTDVEVVGDPLAIEDLRLATNGMGPIGVGDDGDTVLGQLAATFGQPDSDSGTVIATGEFGACPGESIQVVHFGPLAIIITDPDLTPVFSGYRLDLGFGNLESRAAELQTVSGLKAGDTIEALETIYSGFNIDYEVAGDTGLVFLLSTEGGRLLLWGPVTSAEQDGRISGIYSPDSCTEE